MITRAGDTSTEAAEQGSPNAAQRKRPSADVRSDPRRAMLVASKWLAHNGAASPSIRVDETSITRNCVRRTPERTLPP